MKNGKYSLIFVAALAVFLIRKKNMNNLNRYREYPSINQFCNRLTEFFDKSLINGAEQKFLTLIDHGFDPLTAFNATIERVSK